MSDLNKMIIEFDYSKNVLRNIVKEVESVDKTNLEDVKESIKGLVKVRRAIQAKGKSYRDDANAFNKRVIAEEKEYTSIIEPSEIEMKEVLEKEEERIELEARKQMIPMKRKQLSLISGDENDMISDSEMLSMSDEKWISYLSDRFKVQEYKEQAKKEKQASDERHAKEIKEATEKARLEGIAQAEEDAKRKESQKVNEELFQKKQKEAEDRRMAKDSAYKNFLAECNFNEQTDRIIEEDGVKKVYRFVAAFEK